MKSVPANKNQVLDALELARLSENPKLEIYVAYKLLFTNIFAQVVLRTNYNNVKEPKNNQLIISGF